MNLPDYGLDKIVWQPGWAKTPKTSRQAQIRDLASKPEWVVDGVSDILLDAADVIVFLDVSRRTSFARCIKRNWRFMFRGRPELPPNCPELLIIPYLAKLIWQFPMRVRPQILAKMQKRQSGSYIVRNDKELQVVLRDLGIERA